MLSFAGVPLALTDPGGKVQAWLDRFRAVEDLQLYARPPAYADGRARPQGMWPHAVGLPTYNWRHFPPRWRLNSLWWPTGASRFSVGLFMTSLAGVKQIQEALGIGSPGSESDGSGTLVLGDGKRTVSAKMYLLPPRPIGAVGTDNPVVLLPLVDLRYFWQWSKSGTFFIGPLSTWADVRGQILTGLGEAGVTTPAPEGYEAPDWSEFNRFHENAALALDGYAATVGQRFVATLAGGYQLQTWSTAQGTATSNLQRHEPIAGGVVVNLFPNNLGVGTPQLGVPGAVSVVFHRRQGGIIQQNGVCTSITLGPDGGPAHVEALGTAVIHTTFQANHSSRGAGADNASAMQALAQAIARDFYGWRRHQYSATLPGVANAWEITGYDDYLWFMHGTPQPPDGCDCEADEREGFEADPCERPVQYLCQTLIESQPVNVGVEENLTQQPATAAPRTFRPTPLHRAELTADWQTSGGSGPPSATARLLYESSGAFPPTGTFAKDGHDIKIFDTLNKRGSSKSGDKVWVAALPADSQMFELISGDGSQELIVFQIQAVFEAGGEGQARICNLVDGEWVANGASIIVIDGYSVLALWRGKLHPGTGQGAKGVAFKRPDGKYEIVFMEMPDGIVEFTVHSSQVTPPHSGIIKAQINYSYQHGDLQFPSGVVDILDTNLLYPYALPTGKGIAAYDLVLDSYNVLFCQQMTKHAYALLGDEMCGNGDFPIADFIATDFSPFNLTPDPPPNSATNIHGHKGMPNFQVSLEYDEHLRKWVVQNVDKETGSVLLQFPVDGPGPLRLAAEGIEGYMLEVAVERCGDPAWRLVIPTGPCKNPCEPVQ